MGLLLNGPLVFADLKRFTCMHGCGWRLSTSPSHCHGYVVFLPVSFGTCRLHLNHLWLACRSDAGNTKSLAYFMPCHARLCAARYQLRLLLLCRTSMSGRQRQACLGPGRSQRVSCRWSTPSTGRAISRCGYQRREACVSYCDLRPFRGL